MTPGKRPVFLDARARAAPFDLLGEMRGARKRSGKGPFAQLAEIVRLARGPGMIGPVEYYGYRLYDDGEHTAEAKARFAGDKMRGRLHRTVIDKTWHAVSVDKILFYLAMRGLEMPIPRTLALFHASRTFGAVPVLRDGAALRRHLAEAPLPFFCKPVASTGSSGTAHIVGREGGELVTADGRRVALERFAQDIETFADGGYLFQERLGCMPDLLPTLGDRLSGVRCVVILEGGRPALIRATWKIPTGTNHADNFWRAGNLVGAIDPATGRVERVVHGAGARQREVDVHPDTGRPLKGIVLPDWSRVVELCTGGAAALPGLPLQGWDIVLATGGPTVMEMEYDGGSQALTQYATGRGLLDERFVAFLAQWHAARERRAATLRQGRGTLRKVWLLRRLR